MLKGPQMEHILKKKIKKKINIWQLSIALSVHSSSYHVQLFLKTPVCLGMKCTFNPLFASIHITGYNDQALIS